ncbi:MAG TPA: hypothetical protein VNL77_05535 [Roseiflexaceae bacterium]|nr:hypothetical protein [Roseiflexaceae bacterium]
MTTPDLLCGAAARVVTPPLGERPVFLAGFRRDRRASGVESELYVRALALRLGERAAAIVACDQFALGRPDVDEVRMAVARHLDPQALVVACTHSHSTPDTLGLWGPDERTSGVDPVYLARVKRAIAEAVAEALTFACPTRMRAASTRLPGHIANLRTPGLVDDALAALQFVKPDGEVIATLLNLACHPEVLDGDSTLISADYAGHACHAVEQAAGGTALHLSGALGGMLSPAVAERTPAAAAHMGRAYAEAALAALADAPLHDVERLEFRRAELRIPLRNPLFAAARAAGVLRARPGDQIATTVSYLDLGPAQVAGVPGELLPRLGLQLKAAMPGPHTLIAGLADDEIGYILPDDEFVPPADYLNPGAQYEESMSLGPDAGSLVVGTLIGLIGGGGSR